MLLLIRLVYFVTITITLTIATATATTIITTTPINHKFPPNELNVFSLTDCFTDENGFFGNYGHLTYTVEYYYEVEHTFFDDSISLSSNNATTKSATIMKDNSIKNTISATTNSQISSQEEEGDDSNDNNNNNNNDDLPFLLTIERAIADYLLATEIFEGVCEDRRRRRHHRRGIRKRQLQPIDATQGPPSQVVGITIDPPDIQLDVPCQSSVKANGAACDVIAGIFTFYALGSVPTIPDKIKEKLRAAMNRGEFDHIDSNIIKLTMIDDLIPTLTSPPKIIDDNNEPDQIQAADRTTKIGVFAALSVPFLICLLGVGKAQSERREHLREMRRASKRKSSTRQVTVVT